MSKYQQRGLNEEETKFRHGVQRAFQSLKKTMPGVSFCMVLEIMRGIRDGKLTEQDAQNRLKKMLSERKQRLRKRKLKATRRRMKNAVQAEETKTAEEG